MMQAMMAKGIALSSKGSHVEHEINDDYIARLVDDPVELDGQFVWDTGNGAAGPSVRALISKLSGQHELLFEEVDGTFPNHHPDPVDPHTLAFLQEACDKIGAICGLGFDGDGDRLGVIDAKGRPVPGDILTAFLGVEFLARCPGETILFDVKSSQTAMKIITQAGGNAQLWKTGHSHMKTKMAEINCQLAGEMSGHIFIKDGYFGYDDALYVAMRVLQTMTKTKTSITAFMDALPPSYTSPECRVECDDNVKFDVMDALQALVKTQYDAQNITLIDGIRVNENDGWWLIRASNTEAALVVRAEGINETALNAKINDVRTLLATQNIHWSG